MRPPALAIALLTASCAPTSADAPRPSWELVLPSRRFEELAALPNGIAVAVGSNPSSAGDSWIAIADRDDNPWIRDRAGHRIAVTVTPDDEIAVVNDGLESSPFDRNRPGKLQLIAHTDILATHELSTALPTTDTIAPVGDAGFLLAASDGLAVVDRDGTTRWSTPEYLLDCAAVLDDAILASAQPPGQGATVPTPIPLRRIAHDGAAIDSTAIAVPDRAVFTALAPAGTDAFAIALILEPHVAIPHTSLGRIRPDGTWHEIANSDELDDVAWFRGLAVDPDGGVVVVGERLHTDAIDLRAFGPDDEPRWTLELEPPRVAGVPSFTDVIGLDPNLRVAIATDGSLVVGGHDGCCSSWLLAFDPPDR